MDDETFLKRAIEEDSQPIGVGAPPTNDRGPEGEAAELLPCPFCGAGGCLVQTEDIYYVQCSDCYAESDVRSVKESAVIVWNRRASPSSAALVAARVEEREQCAVIADIEKRKGISNLNSDNDDSDYDEGYTEAAQFIAMTIRALEQVKEEKQNAKG